MLFHAISREPDVAWHQSGERQRVGIQCSERDADVHYSAVLPRHSVLRSPFNLRGDCIPSPFLLVLFALECLVM